MSNYEFENFLVGIVRQQKKIDDMIESISISSTSVVRPDVRNMITDLRDRWGALIDNLYDPSFRSVGEAKKWLVDLKAAIADWRAESLGNFANDYVTIMCASRSAGTTILKAINDGKGSLTPQVVSSATSLGELYDQWNQTFPSALKSAVVDSRDSIAQHALDVYDKFNRDKYTIAESSLVDFSIGNVVNAIDAHILRLVSPTTFSPLNGPILCRSNVRAPTSKGTTNNTILVFNDDERTTKVGVVVDAIAATPAPSDIFITKFQTGGFSLIGNFLERGSLPLTMEYSDGVNTPNPVEVPYTLSLFRQSISGGEVVTDQVYNKVIGSNKEIVITVPNDASDINNIYYNLKITGLPALTAGSAILAGFEINSVSFATDSGAASVLLGNTNNFNTQRAFKSFVGTCSYPLIEKALPLTIIEGFKMLRQYNAFLALSSSGYGKTIADAITPDWQKLTGSSAVLDFRIYSISYWLSPTPDLNISQKQILYNKFYTRMIDYLRMAAVDGNFHAYIAEGY